MFIVTAILVFAVQHASTQELGEIFNVTVEQELPEAFKYIVDTRNHTLQTIKITVTSPAATVGNPVLVSVNQLRGVTSWQIPFIDQGALYYEVGHILCPTLNNPLDELADGFNVTVVISTFSKTPVEVFIEAIAIERKDFILELDKPITVGVTSSSPVYYAFHFTPGIERVLIKVQSSHDTEDICAVASMQIASCPSDGVNSELFSEDGAFQSMRSLAAITTDRPDSQNFFYLVVAVFESSNDCRVSDSRGGLKDTSLTDNNDFLSSQINYAVKPHGPVKNVTIVIEEALANSDYAVPVIVSILFFLVIFYGGVFIELTIVDYFLYNHDYWIKLIKRENADQVNFSPMNVDDVDNVENGTPRLSRSKRRPSLFKVITGTYLNDIIRTRTSSVGQVSSTLDLEGTAREYSEENAIIANEQLPEDCSKQFLLESGHNTNEMVTEQPELQPHCPHTAATAEGASPSDQLLTEVQICKELPESTEQCLVEMQPLLSVKSQTAVAPTSPTITSSQLETTSPPQLSHAPLSVAEQAVQVNIRPMGQKRTAKDWMVVTLADVNICEGEEEQVRYRRYCWHLFTITIFYALPAFQLILTYQQLLNTTGNQDICYYNYLCSHRLGEVSAFNNVWSNVGYVALGILFILLVARRQMKYKAIEDSNLKLLPSNKTGVPQHFGIYYTIGVALVAEGFMSAFYHVCPNDANFQFDTAFMFIIAGMGIYQIFHNRHQEFTPNAHILYLSFAVLIVFGFVGTLFPSVAFWIIMIILHLAWVVFMSFQFYYNGIIKCRIRANRKCCNWDVAWKLLHKNYTQFPSHPHSTEKLAYVIILNFVNLLLVTYGLVFYFTSSLNFNTYVLNVMISNLTLYLIYYIAVKCKHHENDCHRQNLEVASMQGNIWQRQHLPPKLFIYLLFAVLCWIFAIFFFTRAESDWTLSPARSRDINEDCQLMGFFNSHDIWHFLSAIALFFSLLILLSLDDNQEDVSRNKIHVF